MVVAFFWMVEVLELRYASRIHALGLRLCHQGDERDIIDISHASSFFTVSRQLYSNTRRRRTFTVLVIYHLTVHLPQDELSGIFCLIIIIITCHIDRRQPYTMLDQSQLFFHRLQHLYSKKRHDSLMYELPLVWFGVFRQYSDLNWSLHIARTHTVDYIGIWKGS
jgi:hypothetical protein